MEFSVFFIYDKKIDKQIGYISTNEEAIRILIAGEGRYSYSEVSSNKIGDMPQICYENLFE